MCDPCLSTLCVPWCKKELYKYSFFPFLFPFLSNQNVLVSISKGIRAVELCSIEILPNSLQHLGVPSNTDLYN